MQPIHPHQRKILWIFCVFLMQHRHLFGPDNYYEATGRAPVADRAAQKIYPNIYAGDLSQT